MIHNFSELLEKARDVSAQRERPVRVVVAAANDNAALSALLKANEMDIADGLLIGNKQLITETLQNAGVKDLNCFEIIEADDEKSICQRAIAAIHAGEAEIVLKGKVKSASLLKAAFDSQKGLRTGKIISDTFLFEYPDRPGENKLMMITDGGFNLTPDLNEKIQILENAVQVAHALGNDNPKVAILSAAETVNPKLQSTVDAAIISKMNQRGQIKGCIVDGPLALDNAVSEEAARIKGIDSPVAGKADILLFPNIESANITAKATTYFSHFRLAHATMGAKAPILIPSRNDTADAKLLTLALNVVIFG